MAGLRNGFWPFHGGEWKALQKEIEENFISEDRDFEALRAFRDKELSNDHWSPSLPHSTLLPGMKLSLMFVIW